MRPPRPRTQRHTEQPASKISWLPAKKRRRGNPAPASYNQPYSPPISIKQGTQAQDHTTCWRRRRWLLGPKSKKCVKVERWRLSRSTVAQGPPRTNVASNPTTLSRPIGRHAPTEDTWETSRPIIIVITIGFIMLVIKSSSPSPPKSSSRPIEHVTYPQRIRGLPEKHVFRFWHKHICRILSLDQSEQEAFSRICLQSKTWHHSGPVSLCVLSALLTLKVVVSSSKF